MKQIQSNRGAALIITIMAMVIMTTIVIEFAYNTRVDVSMLSNYRSTQQGRYFAEVGVEAAKILLLSDLERDATGDSIDYYAFDASRESVKDAAAAQQSGQLPDAGIPGMPPGLSAGKLEEVWSMMTAEMPAIPLADTGGQVKLTIQDEQGKVNLNQFDFPRGFLIESPEGKRWTHFFEACGVDESEGAALIPMLLDWIDRDNDPQTNGGESQLYEQLNPGYMVRNGPIQGLDELRLIEGITNETWGKITPHATVFPQSNALQFKLNVNTASAVALQSLDPMMTEEVANAIIEQRNKAPFKAVSEFQQVLSAYPEINQNVLGKITLRSDIFSVRSAAVVNGVEFTVYAVLQRQKGNKEVKILYWRAE